VLWKDITAGTVLRFMDQSFTNATTGVLGTETDMSLSFSSGLTAGTVIRVEDTGATLVNGGSFSGTKTGSLSGISASGDQVFIYQGTAMGSGTDFTGRTLLHGFNIADTNWVTSAADSNRSFLPTAISGLDASLDSGNFDNADYTGARTGMTAAAYRAAVANLANYTQNDTRFDLATGGFTSTASVSLHWDADGAGAGNGGGGTWDSTTPGLFKNGASGTTSLHWVNSSTGNEQTAVFGGTAGTVSVASGGVTASGLTFSVSGYTVQNNTITLFGSTPTISVTTAGHTATISSAIAGTGGLIKSGAGKLTLSGANTYTGATTVNSGTLEAAAAGALTTTNSIQVNSGGTLLLSGGASSVNASAPVNLNGGTINTAGNSISLGALILAADSTFDFGTTGSSTLTFASKASFTSGSIETLDHWTSGSDHLVFTADPGLGTADLANISFFDDAHSLIATGGQQIAFGLGGFEIVPVPEPTTRLGAAGLLGFLGYRDRRRVRCVWSRRIIPGFSFLLFLMVAGLAEIANAVGPRGRRL